MRITVARTLSQLVAAGEVIHDAFAREGIIHPQASGVYLHPQHLTGSSLMVLAIYEEGEVAATVGVILDGVHGLPLDDVFGPTLDDLRREHSRIAELGVIASCMTLPPAVIDEMICAAWWWAHRMGAGYIVTSCHPHHSRLYGRRYGVVRLTETRLYPKFRDAEVDILGATWDEGLAHARGEEMLRRYEPAEDFAAGRYTGGWSCVGCSRSS